MAHRLSTEQTAIENGYDLDDNESLMMLVLIDSVIPACCSEGCMVEPDGTCPHGFPALTLELM